MQATFETATRENDRDRKPWRSQTVWTFAALGIGTILGLLAPAWATDLQFIFHVFIRLVESIVGPLVFATIVAGIAEVRGSLQSIRTLAAKTFVYFFVVTGIALFLGALSAEILKPGEVQASRGLNLVAHVPVIGTLTATFVDRFVPSSIAQAMAEGNLPQIVVFSTLFGLACLLSGEPARPAVSLCKSVTAIMLRYTEIVMYIAPLAVVSAMAGAVAAQGIATLGAIVRLLVCFFLGQLMLALLVLIPIACLSGVGPIHFLTAMKEPAVLAFSTASSLAGLPSALRRLQGLGVPTHVAAFSLPLGLSFNLAGTCVYLGVTFIFCSQFSGRTLSPGTTLLVLATLLITSKGLAGVPRSAMVVLVGALGTFGVPTTGVAIVLGADVIMDMTRTAVNLLGACLTAVALARWSRDESPEGDLGEKEP